MPKRNAFALKLLGELEETLAHGTVARRVQMLRSITDLFVAGGVDYADDQLERVRRRVRLPRAEHGSLGQGAAGQPPCAASGRAAAHHSHARLRRRDRGRRAGADPVAAARRRRTDRERPHQEPGAPAGDLEAQRSSAAPSPTFSSSAATPRSLTSTAGNPGAEFTEAGYAKLVDRAESNDQLAACVGSRAEHSAPSPAAADRQGIRHGARAAAEGPSRHARRGRRRRQAGRRERAEALGGRRRRRDGRAVARRKLHEAGQLERRRRSRSSPATASSTRPMRRSPA